MMQHEPTIEIYSSYNGRFMTDEWFWRLKARNGKIIADGSEGYATADNARRAVNRMLDLIGNVVIKVL